MITIFLFLLILAIIELIGYAHAVSSDYVFAKWKWRRVPFFWTTVLFKRDDWRPVWTDYSKGSRVYQAWYEIQYSKRKNKYRLITGGYWPKEWPEYKVSVRVLNGLINSLETGDKAVEEAIELLKTPNP